MSEVAAELASACSGLFSGTRIEEFQSLDPDPIPSCACARARDAQQAAGSDALRDARGRFAKGHSGNPQGRPRGIRKPRRRPLGLLLRQARPGMLAPLIARKRHLRLPVLGLVSPPPACRPDPASFSGSISHAWVRLTKSPPRSARCSLPWAAARSEPARPRAWCGARANRCAR